MYDGYNVVLVLDGKNSNATTKKYTWGLDLSGLSGNATSAGVVVQASLPAAGIHGAGGIGGLLAVCETQGTPSTSDDASYWYLYDANGNVGQILATTKDGQGAINGVASSPAARYEYDPYGNVIGPDPDGDGDWQEHAAAYALANPIRFSTKWLDTETALAYYGYRYYSPRLGRWVSRDPIGHSARATRQDDTQRQPNNQVTRFSLGLDPNLFAFVRNSPTGTVDPLGLKSVGCCGQDVTPHLRKMRAAFTTSFNKAPRAQQVAACHKIFNPVSGWDVAGTSKI